MPKHWNDRASGRSSFLAHAGSNPAPRALNTTAAGSAHAGSKPAPRALNTTAAGSAHAGSKPAPRALNTTAGETVPQGHRARGRSGGARAHRRRISASKGKKAAMPGVYGPRDFSAWGWTQDPRFRRPEAWQNELPLSSTLLEQCVLVVSEKLEQPEWEASPPDLLKISPVGVLCTPTRTEALWWVTTGGRTGHYCKRNGRGSCH